MAQTASEYVQLHKESITEQSEEAPGELSQPVDVPALHVLRCGGCGQVLPPDYIPPQDEPWSSGIFDCTLDSENMIEGAVCPCVVFGKNVERIKDDVSYRTACVCHAIVVEGGIAAAVATGYLTSVLAPGTSCLIWECLLLTWWICGIYTGLFRQELQRKYHLKNAPCDPCCVHCFLHQCALCQEHREMKHRLIGDDGMSHMHPPTEQEMTPEPQGLIL